MRSNFPITDYFGLVLELILEQLIHGHGFAWRCQQSLEIDGFPLQCDVVARERALEHAEALAVHGFAWPWITGLNVMAQLVMNNVFHKDLGNPWLV